MDETGLGVISTDATDSFEHLCRKMQRINFRFVAVESLMERHFSEPRPIEVPKAFALDATLIPCIVDATPHYPQ